jgi:hypothetical protein
MATTRKNIDFPLELVTEMDRLREERGLTYNEITVASVRAYLSSTPEMHSPASDADERLGSIDQRLVQLEGVAQSLPALASAIEEELATIQQVLSRLVSIVERRAPQPQEGPGTTVAPAAKDQPGTVTPESSWWNPSREESQKRPLRTWSGDRRPEPEPSPASPMPQKRSWWRGGRA